MLKKMRQCRLNFAENRYDCEAGIIGEHYATELIVTPPVIMPSEAVYRLCFEPGGLSEIILQTTDGTFSYPLPSAVTATSCCVTLIGYVGSEQIYKSRMVRLHFSQAADGDSSIIDPRQPGIVDEVNQNTAARHGHDNKAVLDLLSESDDGNLQFDGKALGGGGGASTAEDISYTLPEDVQTTFPDIVELESDTVKGGLDVAMYYALAGMFAKYISCNLQSGSGETVSMDLQRILDGFVFPAMFKAHEHDNKSILDLISAVDGKLRYNGSDVGLKGEKGEKGDKGEPGTPGAPGAPGSDATVTKANVVAALGYTPQAVSAQVTAGTEITLADNTEYRLTDVTTLTLTYPTGNFECWLKLSFAASGSVTVTLPTGTKYIGNAPSFANGETWELSFKDKVLAAQKVGDGT